MAHKKVPEVVEGVAEIIARRAKEFDRDYPIIDTRHYIVEVTPAYTEWGYMGQDVDEKRVAVSPYYAEKSDAQKWYDAHEAEKGNKLTLVTQHKRRFVSERWV